MKPAILYLRVSTLGQASNGVSLDTQLARAKGWATANDYSVSSTEIYSDPGISAKRADNRPGLQAALEAACRTKGALVVYSLSRLARSVDDALAIVRRLDRAGADFVSLTESIDTTTAAGRLAFTLLAAVAAFQRELTGENVAAVLARKRESGTKYGEIPYGYRLELDPNCKKHRVDPDKPCTCRLVVAPEEQIALDQIGVLRNDGQSWRSIANSLNAAGSRTKKGMTWTAQNARKIAMAH